MYHVIILCSIDQMINSEFIPFNYYQIIFFTLKSITDSKNVVKSIDTISPAQFARKPRKNRHGFCSQPNEDTSYILWDLQKGNQRKPHRNRKTLQRRSQIQLFLHLLQRQSLQLRSDHVFPRGNTRERRESLP